MKYYIVKGKRLKFSNQKEYSELVAVSERYEGLLAKKVSEKTISNHSVCNTRLHACRNASYKVKYGCINNKIMLVECLQSNFLCGIRENSLHSGHRGR